MTLCRCETGAGATRAVLDDCCRLRCGCVAELAKPKQNRQQCERRSPPHRRSRVALFEMMYAGERKFQRPSGAFKRPAHDIPTHHVPQSSRAAPLPKARRRTRNRARNPTDGRRLADTMVPHNGIHGMEVTARRLRSIGHMPPTGQIPAPAPGVKVSNRAAGGPTRRLGRSHITPMSLNIRGGLMVADRPGLIGHGRPDEGACTTGSATAAVSRTGGGPGEGCVQIESAGFPNILLAHDLSENRFSLFGIMR